MIKLLSSVDVPVLQIPGDWVFPLIVIYVGSHCCPGLGLYLKPSVGGCTRGGDVSSSFITGSETVTSHMQRMISAPFQCTCGLVLTAIWHLVKDWFSFRHGNNESGLADNNNNNVRITTLKTVFEILTISPKSGQKWGKLDSEICSCHIKEMK